ncbi:MAG: hypothetical protein HYX75_08830 [Acidobacteria bacterium]|nr:hypothetical protein [Acidobacteriota bacterium]
MRIAYYVSGHGFGHATRSCVVAAALAAEHDVWIVSPVAETFLRSNAKAAFQYRSATLDVGVIQPDSMTPDFPATVTALDLLHRRSRHLVDQEVGWLRALRIERVLVDIPPLACVAASEAGIQAAVLTNFTWDDIYREYVTSMERFEVSVGVMGSQYARASVLLRLPFGTGMEAIREQKTLGMVARVARLDRSVVRARMGLGQGRVGLLSYGGLGLGNHAPDRWNIPPGWSLISVGGVPGDRNLDDGVRMIPPELLTRLDLSYTDILAAVDAVLTKPGYGIVSDCVANRTPVLYSDRGPFAEYPLLVEGIRRFLPNVFLNREALRTGEVRGALEQIEGAAWPAESMKALTPREIRDRIGAILA